MFKWLLVLALVAPLTACLEDKEEQAEQGAEIMVESSAQDDVVGDQPAPDEAAPAEGAESAEEAEPAE